MIGVKDYRINLKYKCIHIYTYKILISSVFSSHFIKIQKVRNGERERERENLKAPATYGPQRLLEDNFSVNKGKIGKENVTENKNVICQI